MSYVYRMRDKSVTEMNWAVVSAVKRFLTQNRHPSGLHAMRRSRVAKQRHETKVHVLLDMAVKEREARLVGYQIHRGASPCGNDHRVLLDPGSRLAVELDEFEQVPVHMQRVRIVAAIVKYQAVTASLSEQEFPFMRIFFAVDEPAIDPIGPAGRFLKDHVDDLVWRRMRRVRAKDRVVPARLRRRSPSRALLLIGVLHYDSHAGLPRHIAQL